MIKLGYGSLQSEQFVGFQVALTRGVWKTVPAGHPKNGDAPIFRASVLPFFKGVLMHAISLVVAAQDAANDTVGAEPKWAQAERRFVTRVQLLTLDKDPAVVEAASKVQAILADGGSTVMVNRSAEGKVDFGRNQLAVAVRPGVASLVEKLALTDALDDIRACTDELAGAIGGGDHAKERVSRSRRIMIATASCASAFTWVHAGLISMIDRTDDPAVRAEIDAMTAPFDALLARRPASAAVADPVPAPVVSPDPAAPPAQSPLAHTG